MLNCDHPQENLAKFGCNSDMKIKKHLSIVVAHWWPQLYEPWKLATFENYEPWNWPLFFLTKRYKKYSTHRCSLPAKSKTFNVRKVCPWLANYVQISCAHRSCLRFYSMAMKHWTFFGVHCPFVVAISIFQDGD